MPLFQRNQQSRVLFFTFCNTTTQENVVSKFIISLFLERQILRVLWMNVVAWGGMNQSEGVDLTFLWRIGRAFSFAHCAVMCDLARQTLS